MDIIRQLRANSKNKEALELALNHNRNGISDSDLISLLDEIVITSWYVDKKNIGVNAALEMMKIYNSSDLELPANVKANILHVLPDNYNIDISKIPYFTLTKECELNHVIYVDSLQKLFRVNPPFLIIKKIDSNLLDKLSRSSLIQVKYFINKIDTSYLTLCLTKKWKLELDNNTEVVEISGIRSWDVFDTLMARKCHYPDGVMQLVQKKTKINNFHQVRRHCENMSPSTYDDIYKQMENHYDLNTVNMLKKEEYASEMENLYPIRENLDRVKDGDILVSDNYYSEQELRGFLDNCGLKVKYTLYVSYGGKGSGKMWEKLSKIHQIIAHTGDSQHADVNMARLHGVNGVHFNPNYTHSESLLKSQGMEHLSLVSRYLRLSNPYRTSIYKNEKLGLVSDSLGIFNSETQKSPIELETDRYYLWNLEAQFNIPLLLMYSDYLNLYCQNLKVTRILMCTRDCSKFHKIFKRLYPEYEVIYFHASRDAYNKCSNTYLAYIQSLLNPNTLIVDLVGTGKSGDLLYGKLGYPKRFMFWGYPGNNNSRNNIDFLDTSAGQFLTMEILNFDHSLGPLLDVISGKTEFPLKNGSVEDNNNFIDIRGPPETGSQLDFVDGMIESYFENRHIFEFNKNQINQNAIKSVVHEFRSILNAESVKLNNIFQHNEDNGKNLVTLKTIRELANKYGSDKGDQNFHKHQYSRVYDEIFLPYKFKPLKILEIGLSIASNRDKSTSIQIWADYFPQAKVYGFDILNFSIHNDSRITTFQGDQSNPVDLKKFINLYGNDFDIIIDDGYHTSLCQQTSLNILFVECLKPGGIYIIEDLHYQPEPETGSMIKTKEYLRKIKSGVPFEYSLNNHSQIVSQIKELSFYDTLTPESQFSDDAKKDALCVIYKIN